ncbi:MAG TPA: UDP-glucose--hexose-1-phosphate uridylyltransferase [Anaerolineales bacterium]|nr:UDP-glucose--hexose-1-phosphate uridylyltransferase [Anaerolineales bacterium]
MDFELPHRRFNPLTRDWVVVSPQRTRRPWLGQLEKPLQEEIPLYDPACMLCPGNQRSSGSYNPDYTGTFVFENDFPALLGPEQGEQPIQSVSANPDGSLFTAQSEYGICRVVCFSPRHDLQIPQMHPSEVEAVIRTWIDQTVDLGSPDFTRYVQIFENKGTMMGASNPHPHSQIWATSHLPNEPAKELVSQSKYLSKNNSCLLCSVLEQERRSGERLVVANQEFTALVPFWAVWPFEVLVIANRHVADLPALGEPEIAGLADLMRRLTTRYDNLFEIAFPYSMGFHQSPADGLAHPEHHLHAHYYPPLLRSAMVRKFMVGFEMLASPQRDLTPEAAAERLRQTSEVHYRGRPG